VDLYPQNGYFPLFPVDLVSADFEEEPPLLFPSFELVFDEDLSSFVSFEVGMFIFDLKSEKIIFAGYKGSPLTYSNGYEIIQFDYIIRILCNLSDRRDTFDLNTYYQYHFQKLKFGVDTFFFRREPPQIGKCIPLQQKRLGRISLENILSSR